ncbi:MAG TPA: hypothetical protein VI386_19500 [Candidatus Sulfotelmatobacter sp.]
MTGRMAALRVLVLGLAIGSAASIPKAAESQTRPSRSQQAVPQSAHVPYQYQETWYEFVLRQFNPNDVDYGRWIERERRAFIDARIRNPYFMYSLCTSLGLLLAAVLYTKLWIDHRRAMWITAEIMADIYNQDAYSRRIAQQAIEKYNTHIEHCNRAIEAAEHGEAVSKTGSEIEQLRGELICVTSERDTATRERDLAREELQEKSEILAEMSIRLETLTNKSGVAGDAKRSPDLRGADPKLVTHINNLQEQLYAERHTNRKLKGA